MAGRRPLIPQTQVRSLPPVPRVTNLATRSAVPRPPGWGRRRRDRAACSPLRGGAARGAGRHARPSLRPELGTGKAAPVRPRLASSRRETAGAATRGPTGPHCSLTTEIAIWRGRTRAPVCRCSSTVERAPVKRMTVVRSHPPTPVHDGAARGPLRPHGSEVERLSRIQEAPVRLRMGAPLFMARSSSGEDPGLSSRGRGFDSPTGCRAQPGS